MVKVFFSHSSRDKELAEALLDLLRSALNLKGDEIRCTSIGGHRLAGGADTDEELRREIMEAPVFIGLMSEASVESTYVLFELGARWGAGKYLVPLLALGSEVSILRGPIGGKNALRCDDASQLHQLLDEVGRSLGIRLEQAAVYQKQIDRVLGIGKLSQAESHAMLGSKRMPPPPTRRTDMILLRCIQSDRSYNAGEIAGFSPKKAKELISSGKWVPVNDELLKVAKLVLIEFEYLNRAYDRSDEPAVTESRAKLALAVDRYLSAAHNYPSMNLKQFHLKVYRSLADAVEVEKEGSAVDILAASEKRSVSGSKVRNWRRSGKSYCSSTG